MEIKVKDKIIDIEPNSKPYLLKRIVADLFDVGVLFFVWFMLNLGFFNSGMANTYNMHITTQTKIKDSAMLTSGYGEMKYVDDDTSTQGYIIYTEENTNKEYIVVKKSEPTEEEKKQYSSIMNSSQAYKDAVFGASVHRYVISGFSCLLSEGIFFLLVPLVNKKRATCGQLLMGISLYSIRYQKYARWYHVLFRFLFIYFIESLLIYLICGIYTFMLIPVLSLIIMLISKNTNRVIRDYITGTMLIENKSYIPIN